MSRTNQIISKNIKRIRKEKGLTQQELAEKMGMKRQQVTAMETDQAAFTIQTIEKVIEVLEIDIMKLFEE